MQRKVPVAVLATGAKGRAFLQALVSSDRASVDYVQSYAQQGTLDDSLSAIREMCRERSIPLTEGRRMTDSLPDDAELIFVVGWQFLLPPDPRMVVFHDSLLPKYRGFAPTVAALISGDRQLGVTALRPASEPDAGPILAQHVVPVSYPVKIRDVLDLLTDAYVECALTVLGAHAEGALLEVPQNDADATFSIWRDDDDYLIDWSDDADKICRTIDALGYPYPGARTAVGGKSLTVLDARPGPDLRFEHVHPGKIWSIADGIPTVVCGNGTVVLTDVRDAQGESYVFDRLRVRLG